MSDELIDVALRLAEGQQKEARLHSRDEAPELYDLLAGFLPDNTPKQMYSVVVPPGKEITTHTHKEHVVLFYPERVLVPVVVDGYKRYPAAGSVQIVYAGTPHGVPKNTTSMRRVSIALKVLP